ncbi:MAG: hypothetical protein ABIE84_02165 [bacterium]
MRPTEVSSLRNMAQCWAARRVANPQSAASAPTKLPRRINIHGRDVLLKTSLNYRLPITLEAFIEKMEAYLTETGREVDTIYVNELIPTPGIMERTRPRIIQTQSTERALFWPARYNSNNVGRSPISNWSRITELIERLGLRETELRIEVAKKRTGFHDSGKALSFTAIGQEIGTSKAARVDARTKSEISRSPLKFDYLLPTWEIISTIISWHLATEILYPLDYLIRDLKSFSLITEENENQIIPLLGLIWDWLRPFRASMSHIDLPTLPGEAVNFELLRGGDVKLLSLFDGEAEENVRAEAVAFCRESSDYQRIIDLYFEVREKPERRAYWQLKPFQKVVSERLELNISIEALRSLFNYHPSFVVEGDTFWTVKMIWVNFDRVRQLLDFEGPLHYEVIARSVGLTEGTTANLLKAEKEEFILVGNGWYNLRSKFASVFRYVTVPEIQSAAFAFPAVYVALVRASGPLTAREIHQSTLSLGFRWSLKAVQNVLHRYDDIKAHIMETGRGKYYV